MNVEQKWIHKWRPEQNVKKEEIKFRVDKNRKIHPIPKGRPDKTNVASRMTMNILQNTGRRSGRASVNAIKDEGKQSR